MFHVKHTLIQYSTHNKPVFHVKQEPKKPTKRKRQQKSMFHVEHNKR
jgi:hypothetical protein